jgi:aldehyde dehydrogenase (NAD+)
MIVAHHAIDKIAFTGSTEVGRKIRRATAGQGKALSLELGGKSPYIVFDDADLDSAVEGLVDAIWLNQGQVCCAGSRLLVHEPIAEAFYAKVKTRMGQLRIGNPLDKSIDFGAIVDPAQHAAISALVDENSVGEVYVAPCDMPQGGCFYPPTLITGLSPSDRLMQEEIFGPVLTIYVYADSDWSETIDLVNKTSEYALTGAIFAKNRNVINEATHALRFAAGNFYVNDKPTGAVVGQQPFGGARGSGTNDKAGSILNLLRWVSPRTIKETLVPPTDYKYPHMG